MLESINIPELRIPSVEPTVDNSPQEIAYKIRNYLGVPAGPIDNIVSLLEKNGVIVMFLDVDDMDKFDENIFLTGAEDGLVRICTMNPKGVRGILKNKDKKDLKKVFKHLNFKSINHYE